MKNLFFPRFFLMCASFLFTSDMTAQNPKTDEQDLCKNNKARLAELEQQLATVNSEIANIWVNKQVETARTDMVWIRRVKNVKSEEEFDKVVSPKTTMMVKTKDYNFDLGECLHNSTSTIHAIRYCLGQFETAIGKRIDKALIDQKKYPELTKQKQDIDIRIATHRKNIKLLGCADPDIVLYNNVGFEGNWKAVIDGETWTLNLTDKGVLMFGAMSNVSEEITSKYEVRECLEQGPNKMLCRFNEVIEDEEKIATTKGYVEFQLVGTHLSSTWKESAAPSVKWKPGFEKNILQLRSASTISISFERK